ncbi:MAG TPA: SGNH/GDSL hydrolase family protein [Puia sp.]
MIRFKLFAKKFVAVIFGIFLALVIIEIILRIWHPFVYTVRGDKIILAANIQVRMKNQWIRKLDDTIYYSRNSIGLRGDAWPVNPENYIKIITVGGSTTECKFLSDSRTWPERLKHDLKPDHPNIWLNNAGLDGHSSFGHLVLLKDYLVRLHPNYILFLTGINDVELDRPADLDDQDIRGIHGHSVKYFLKSLVNYTETGTLLLSLYRNYLAYRKGLIHKERDPGQLQVGVTDSLTRMNKIAFQKHYLTNYAGRLKELAAVSVLNYIKPVFITQPALFGNAVDSTTGIFMGNRMLDGYDCAMDWDLLQLYNDEVRNLRADGVAVIDLAAAMPKDSKYFYDFMHYTNAGAEKVAAILADSLRMIIK